MYYCYKKPKSELRLNKVYLYPITLYNLAKKASGTQLDCQSCLKI